MSDGNPKSGWCALALVCWTVSAGCAPMAYKITPVSAERELEETTLIDEGGLSPAKIVLVDVDGLLVNSHKRTLFGEGEQPVSLFTEKLDKAAADPSVKALVLRTGCSYRQRFERNRGMRIDFVLGSPELAERVTGAFIDRDERAGAGASDHAPVVVDLAD